MSLDCEELPPPTAPLWPPAPGPLPSAAWATPAHGTATNPAATIAVARCLRTNRVLQQMPGRAS